MHIAFMGVPTHFDSLTVASQLVNLPRMAIYSQVLFFQSKSCLPSFTSPLTSYDLPSYLHKLHARDMPIYILCICTIVECIDAFSLVSMQCTQFGLGLALQIRKQHIILHLFYNFV